MAEIVLKGVKKVYPGDVTAVRDFHLGIEDKEFIVLVGPSGCGKSTLLRMIAGLEDITEGEVSIGGRVINDVPSKDRDIAMVFQNYALYPHMTVYQNIAFALKLRKTPKAEIDARVREAAQVLGIGHLLGRKPRALSGGERQRVALGRAMVRNPAAFLLDEPLSNLDAKLRAAMRTELIKLHKQLQTTFVYVTHDQTEAMTMGDRIVMMRDGVIQQVDAPQKLYDEPCNAFVAAFIGSPQMNLAEGRLLDEGGEYFVQLDGGRLCLDAGRLGEAARGYAGKRVILGIRPENIHADEGWLKGSPKGVIRATVDVTEQMGAEVFLYLEFGGAKLTARVPSGKAYKLGSQVDVCLDMAKIHLFDPETELAIRG